MKLLKYRVEGFRCLKNIEWIPLSDLAVFTGQNDGGKTSALDILQIFLERRQKPEENDYTLIAENALCEKIIIEGVFELSREEKEELGHNKDKIFIKAKYSTTQNSKYSYKTMVHPDQRLRRDLNTVSIDELKTLADEFGISLSNRRTKSTIVREMEDWLNDQELEEGFLELPSKYFDNFPLVKIFRSSRTLNPTSEVNQTLNASFSTRIQTERYSGRLSDIQDEIEKEMKNDLKDFEEKVREYCPDVAGIEIDPIIDFSRGFRTSTLKLKKEDGLPVDLEKEGEGRKRKITLAVYEWREKILTESGDDRQSIVAFDEPDTHLDYLSQRKILDIIKRISGNEKNSVIVCTHSLNLIDRIPITDIVHFRREDEKTAIEILQTDDPELIDMFLYEISDCMGLKNSIMLNERCFLIVEGDTEFLSLPIIFKKTKDFSLQSGGIRLLNGWGCGGVRSLARFLNNNRRNVLFLLDTDTQNAPNAIFHPNKLREEGFNIETQVFFVGKNEYEDSFSNELYVRAANSNWRKIDGTEWSEQEFSALRASDDFSGRLLTLLRQETHTHICKPDVGRILAKSIAEPSEIPQTIMRCLDQAYALANS